MYFNALCRFGHRLSEGLTSTLLAMIANSNTPSYDQSKNKTLFKAMKLTTIILFTACMQLSANGISQKITVSLKNVRIEKAFKEIEKQTGYNFIYYKDVLDNTNNVNLIVKNEVLENVLESIFKGQPVTYTISGKYIAVKESEENISKTISPNELPPPIEIHGKIMNKQGEPLQNVSVIIVGSTIGTSTNAEGFYTLNVPDNKNTILEISSVGYQSKKVSIGGQKEINILLEIEAVAGTEIVVTALGIKRETKALGYAVQQVKGEELQKAVEPNVMNSLTGKVAGLTVYNSSSMYTSPVFTIRGAKPLVVIDGVPSLSDFWNISPNDIETIDVLKGATATALYGSQGLNGAVIINTKKGKNGANGVELSFNSSTQFNAGFLALPKVQTQYGMGYNGQYEYVDGMGGGVQDGTGYAWGPKLNVPDPNTKSGFVERTQYNSPRDANGNLIPLPWITRGTNNLGNFLREGYLTMNNLSIAGKNDKGNYRLSLTHQYQQGGVPNTELQSITFSLAGDYKLLDKVKAEATLSYNKNFSPNWTPVDYGPTNFTYNILLWMGPDVNINDLKNYWQRGKQGTQQYNYNYVWYNNPWFLANEYLNSYYRDAPVGTLKLTYDMTKDLSLMLRSGANINITNQSLKTPISMVNRNNSTDGAFFESYESSLQIISDFLFSYKKKLSESFDFDISAGGSNRYYSNNFLSGAASGLNVPEVYNMGNSKRPTTAINSISEEKVNSLYGFADLSYRDAVFLNITGRKDWSSALPIQNNSYFYPSASLSVVLSQMFKLPSFISFAKVRGSWSNISSDFQPYSAFAAYSYGTNWNQSNPSLYMGGTLYNPHIQPSKTINKEVGFDLRFLQSRIGIDFAYYNIFDLDQIISLPVSEASGYTSKLINANKFNRRGIEVTLNAVPVKTQNFQWNLTANYSRDRRYLVDLYNTQTNLNGVYPGQRVDLFRGWKWERSPEGKVIYKNGLPVYDASGVQPLGYTTPDWIWGFNTQFKYKSFQLSLGLDGRVGGVFFNGVEDKLWEGGMHVNSVNKYRDDSNNGIASYIGDGVVIMSGELQKDANGLVIKDTRTFDPNSTKVNYYDWVSSYYANGIEESELYKKTFFKLRSVAITYNLSPNILKKTFFKTASVSVVGTNLFLNSKVPYVDPDPITPDYASPFNLEEPTFRTIGINLNFKF